MPGRPRKIIDISTGKISKKNRASRKAQEKKIKLPRDELIAPNWLNDIAKKEFTRVVKAAGEIDLLDNLDLALVAIYANAYSHFIELARNLDEMSDIAVRHNSLEAYDVVSPCLVAQEKYVKQIMQCSTKLGLATTDRLKLIVPAKEDKKINKFMQYLDA